MSFNNKTIQSVRLREFLFIFFLIFTIIFILVEMRNGRYWQSDFEVYYKSAKRALSGENLYRPGAGEDNFYRFKYSPLAAYLFIPFLVFSFAKSKIIFSFLLSFLMCLNYIICFSFYFRNFSQKITVHKNIYLYGSVVFFASLFPIASFFVRELHLGQVNIILLFLYISSFYFLERRTVLSVILLTISGFIKPYFLIFVLYFIYEKKFKHLFYFLISFFGLSIVPLFTYNSTDLINQYYLWFNELKVEIMRESDFGNSGNVSIFSLFDKYISHNISLPSIFIHIFTLTICILFVIYFLNRTTKMFSGETKLFYDFSLLCTFIPLLISNGRSIYIILLPVLCILIPNLSKKNYLQIIMYAIAGLLIGLDVSDGGIYTSWIRTYYLLPVGALLLVGLLLYSVKMHRKFL